MLDTDPERGRDMSKPNINHLSTDEGRQAAKELQEGKQGYLIGAMPNGHVRIEFWQGGMQLAFIELVPDESDRMAKLVTQASELARKVNQL